MATTKVNSYFSDYLSENSNAYKIISRKNGVVPPISKREEILASLNEDTSYFIDDVVSLLIEDDGGFLSNIWNSVKGAWPSFTTWIKGHPIAAPDTPGSDPENLRDKDGKEIIGGLNLPGKVEALSKWMKENPNATAAGLAGAGLLGTYYLFKKFLGKKKLDKQDLAMSQKIDMMDPKKVGSIS